MPEPRKPNEISLTRLYDAPVEAVWDAWTDPEQVANWWGPRGFTLTTHSKDLRVGGQWIYTMHGPDGTDYPNRTTYHVVEPLERLVYDHGANDEHPALFRVTVTFERVGERTRMHMTMALETAEAAVETRRFIKEAGGNATWDRLAEYLEEQHGRATFVIHRVFEAPVEAVFEMWTRPAHLARWLPPQGFRMESLRDDIREGATTFLVLTNDAGTATHVRTEYLEISAPRRLVYTQQFCDADETPSRHPMMPVWPTTLRVVVTFVEEARGETRIMLLAEPEGQSTSEEVAAFLGHRPSMTGGWMGSFDELEALLAAS